MADKIEITLSDIASVGNNQLSAKFISNDDSVDEDGDIYFAQGKGKKRKNWHIFWTLPSGYKFTGDYISLKNDGGQIPRGDIKTFDNDATLRVKNKNDEKKVIEYTLITDQGEIHPTILNRNG